MECLFFQQQPAIAIYRHQAAKRQYTRKHPARTPLRKKSLQWSRYCRLNYHSWKTSQTRGRCVITRATAVLPALPSLTYEQLACALASVAVHFAQPIVHVVERFLVFVQRERVNSSPPRRQKHQTTCSALNQVKRAPLDHSKKGGPCAFAAARMALQQQYQILCRNDMPEKRQDELTSM